jgi:SAM-dependent methyltransferase
MQDRQSIVTMYSEALKKHGPESPEAVLWGTRRTQYFRFKILCDIADLFGPQDYVVLDYGCGLGDLLDYMRFQGFRGRYTGIDITKEAITEAKKKFKGEKKGSFAVLKSDRDVEKYTFDFCLMSGVFNAPNPTAEEHLRSVLKTVFRRTRVGVAVNVLSAFASHKSKELQYFDPFALGAWCMKELTPFVTVRHDYRGGNATLYLYKKKDIDF